jgi:hypothetical protein
MDPLVARQLKEVDGFVTEEDFMRLDSPTGRHRDPGHHGRQ